MQNFLILNFQFRSEERGEMAKEEKEPAQRKQETVFDLTERTALFAETVIIFCASLARSPVLDSLVHQLVRSGTSIGANYTEANNASSRNDFAHKIGLCRKEAGETMYWLRLIGKAHPATLSKARDLWQEAKELNLIFATIFRKSATPKVAPPNQKA